MTPRVLEVEALSLRFGAVTAFEDVSFAVAEGELLAVIGPNGAGKTSLFNVLSCIDRPSHGSVRLRGADVAGLRASDLAGAGVARTVQNIGLFNNLSALDNVLVGRHHLMRSGAVRGGLWWGTARQEERVHRRAAMEALSFCGVALHAGERVGGLAYGVQKRVELARALAMEPSLLLLDEPVAGMSRDERAEITALVRRAHREQGLTIVLVEHDMGMVMQIAERILVLDFGRVVMEGRPAEVVSDDRVIRAYLGETWQATA